MSDEEVALRQGLLAASDGELTELGERTLLYRESGERQALASRERCAPLFLG